MPAPVTTNDLIDFGGPNLSTITELYKLSPQTNQTIEFPTSTTTTVNAVNTASINNAVQLKTEPEKPKSDPAKVTFIKIVLLNLSRKVIFGVQTLLVWVTLEISHKATITNNLNLSVIFFSKIFFLTYDRFRNSSSRK